MHQQETERQESGTDPVPRHRKGRNSSCLTGKVSGEVVGVGNDQQQHTQSHACRNEQVGTDPSVRTHSVSP